MGDSTEAEKLSEMMPRMPGSVPTGGRRRKGSLPKQGSPEEKQIPMGVGDVGDFWVVCLPRDRYSLRVELWTAALNTASGVASMVSNSHLRLGD